MHRDTSRNPCNSPWIAGADACDDDDDDDDDIDDDAQFGGHTPFFLFPVHVGILSHPPTVIKHVTYYAAAYINLTFSEQRETNGGPSSQLRVALRALQKYV